MGLMEIARRHDTEKLKENMRFLKLRTRRGAPALAFAARGTPTKIGAPLWVARASRAIHRPARCPRRRRFKGFPRGATRISNPGQHCKSFF